MKRIRVILGWLLAGAVINVVVAWVIALTICLWAINEFTVAREDVVTERWVLFRTEAFGSEYFRSERDKGGPRGNSTDMWSSDISPSSIVPRWGDLESVSAEYTESPRIMEFRVIEGRGWPWRTVWGEYGDRVYPVPGRMSFDSSTHHGMIDTPFPDWEANGAPRTLPVIPIWPGLVANTIFYAVISWFAVSVPGALRRIIRRRRGHCVRCAYDLRGTDHTACPECGHGLPGTEST